MSTPLSVLILEDSLSDTELMLYELRSSGFELDWQRVETEPDYLTRLDAGFEVILSDFSMPQFDAMRALRLLQERRLDIPLIIVAGSISEEVAVECMKQGAADYLLKDRLVRLGQAVIQAIQQRKLRDQKRQAEAALKESEARFRRLADNAQDIIYRYQVSPTRGFEYVSPAVAAIAGYTPEDHYADPDLACKIVHEDDRRVLQQWVTGKELNQPSILRWCKGGATIWTEHRNVAIYEETGLIAIEGIARNITKRKRAEEALSRALKEQKSIMESVLDIVYVLNLKGNLVRWNKRLEAMTGLSPEELRGRSALAFFPKVEQPTISRAIKEVFEKGRAKVEGNLIGKNQVLLPYEWNSVTLEDEAGNVIGMTGIGRDITERRQVEAALKQSEERYRTISEITSDFSYAVRVTPSGQWLVEWVTEAFFRISGYTLAEIRGNGWSRMIYPDDLPVVEQYYQALISGQSSTKELRIVTKDGDIRWLQSYARPQWNEAQQQLVRILGAAKDITKLKQAEEQLLHNAFHDALTGLPNRALFMDRLGRALEHGKRHKDYLLAVLFLDLDRFKVINDSLGHIVGDQFLITTANRIKACLRPMDTAARLGGDEFTILIEEIKDVSDAVRVAERIQAELKLPFKLSGREILTTVSIGVVLVSATSHDRPEDLLRDADIAMYRAKALGRARYEIFNTDMHAWAVARLQMETDLRRAIERQEFQVYYQPIVSLGLLPGTARITGFEALVRWQHPDRGLIFPEEFMPTAEETGLSIPIDQWVLREACRQAQQWQAGYPSEAAHPSKLPEDGGMPSLEDGEGSAFAELRERPTSTNYPALTISVNVCGNQFRQPELLQHINQVLQETNLNAHSLKLEITENIIMKNDKSATVRLSQLRDLGIQLSIDDFGTGYSSLARLHHFPINGLKIDRSFITQIGGDSSEENRNLEITETIVELAQKLGVDVTAEGVETAEQLAQLRALNCGHGQGYFFSRPLDSQAAEALMISQPQW